MSAPLPRRGEMVAAVKLMNARLDAVGGEQQIPANFQLAAHAGLIHHADLMSLADGTVPILAATYAAMGITLHEALLSTLAQGVHLGVLVERLRWERQRAEERAA